MGGVSIAGLLEQLQTLGIPAAHSYPAEKLAHIAEPVVAVSLQEASLVAQTMVARVTVVSPGGFGAAQCEDRAVEIGEVLTDMGGECVVGSCEFDGRTGLFRTEIRAKFQTEIPNVKINGRKLNYVQAFTSWRTVDEELGVRNLSDASWNFRLEEFFPTGVEEDSDCSEPFGLSYASHNGTETYQGAKWTYQKRTWGSTGVRQIRLGTAESMQME